MTAMSLIVQPHAAYLLTDTAYYLADGTVVGFAPKVFELAFSAIVGGAPATAAFAMTGIITPDHVKAEMEARGLSSIDDVLHVLPAIVRHLSAAIPTAVRSEGVGDETAILLSLAMWDHAAGKPAGFLIGNETCPPVLAGHMQPFVLTRMRNYVMQRATGGFTGHDYSDPAVFDPFADSGALLDDQRADPFGDDATQFTGIGGQGVLTEITAAGIRYHIVRDWPDRVGERITA